MIPKILHFVYITEESTNPFSFHHYVTIRSAMETLKIYDVRLYINIPPKIAEDNDWFAETLKLGVRSIMVPDWNELLKTDLVHHKADFLRLKILYYEGGIVSDLDRVFVISIWNDLDQTKLNMSNEHINNEVTGLQIGLMAAPPEDPFISEWIDSYKNYQSGSGWGTYSILKPFEMYELDTSRVNVLEETEVSYPYPARTFKLFEPNHEIINEKRCKVYHLAESIIWDKYLSRLHLDGELNTLYNILTKKYKLN